MKLTEQHKLLLTCLACALLPLAVAGALALFVPSAAPAMAQSTPSTLAVSAPAARLITPNPWLFVILPLGAAVASAGLGARLLARRMRFLPP